MKSPLGPILGIVLAAVLPAGLPPEAAGKSPDARLCTLPVNSIRAVREYFRYRGPSDMPIVSGHRGCREDGCPENSIRAFEHTLRRVPAFFEIDPRMTKDSVIVLMHDATIDRTTTGTGKVSDYTYAELQQFFLKDREGNVTTYKIPTLEECIAWSQGKTILNLDIKDVPLEVMSQFINRLAPANVMYTVRNAKQARTYLDRDPQAMFSCWCKNMKEFNEYVGERILWSQVMAYVGIGFNVREGPGLKGEVVSDRDRKQTLPTNICHGIDDATRTTCFNT